LWDAATGKPWGEAIKHGDFVESASFSPDGQQVVTVSSDNAARLWRFPAVQPVVTSLPLADGSGKLEFSPDGQSALTISNDFIIVWNLPTGQLVAPPRREAGVEFAQLSADGQFVAAACRDMTVRVWKRGESAERILHHADTITRIEFSADGRRLVTAVGKRVLVWNAESAEPIAGPWVHEEAVQSVRFSADGMRVVSASGNFARVWPLQTGQPEVRSFPHEARVESAMFSPDGRSVATASGVTVRVWDAQTGRILATLHHRKQVNSVSFSPDGTRLVTAAADQTLRVWSAVTGQPLTDPISIEVPVWGAQFTSCGRWIIAKTDLSALMWEMPLAPAPAPAWLAELGEAVAGQRLNDSQVSSPVPTETVLQLRERLATSSKTNSYAIWARWFFADARERAASPAAHLAAKKEDR
jgi:WD40 repeat protein